MLLVEDAKALFVSLTVEVWSASRVQWSRVPVFNSVNARTLSRRRKFVSINFPQPCYAVRSVHWIDFRL